MAVDTKNICIVFRAVSIMAVSQRASPL